MNRLKELRQEKKLSQKEIALELQVPLRTYQRWENGESQIKPDKAQALAKHFGVSVGYLLGYSVTSDNPKEVADSVGKKLYTTKNGATLSFAMDYLYELLGDKADFVISKTDSVPLVAFSEFVYTFKKYDTKDDISQIYKILCLDDQEKEIVLNLIDSLFKKSP
ncbi:helix-turn-helix domain-containing protein [Streptococcus suis]|uniref:helix-turn-helix domain-containing protein n=1 Tax=Streptococcus suis TaxID=1307 RepID=UPI000CF587AF|nr:helix-turn-helix transcriptional regulator [Streptococcus suis]